MHRSDDKYNPLRDVSPAFLETVEDWIARSGEVLVILRYLRAGGAKDYALCQSRGEFLSLVAGVPIGTDIEVFREPQLPIRGVVDAAFIDAAQTVIPNDVEYLLLTLERRPGSQISEFGEIEITHDELRRTLSDLLGRFVAIGVCPDYCAQDNDSLISRAKGGLTDRDDVSSTSLPSRSVLSPLLTMAVARKNPNDVRQARMRTFSVLRLEPPHQQREAP